MTLGRVGDGGEFVGRGDAEPGGGVGGGVDGPEPVDGHVGVALGGFEAGVAEHLGDVADVGAAFEHQGSHGVAQQVAAPSLVDTSSSEVPADLTAQPVRAQRGTGRGDEQVVAPPVGEQRRAAGAGVEPHPEQGPFPDGHEAVLGSFPGADEHGAAVDVDVVDQEPDELARRSPQE